tara:strand:+ start:1161 stop:1544 length:384 start_codon:yes stop_codon:yes gene_type:complete
MTQIYIKIPTVQTHLGYINKKSIKINNIFTPYNCDIKSEYAFNLLMFYFGHYVHPELRTKHMTVSNVDLFLYFLNAISEEYTEFSIKEWKKLFFYMREKNKIDYLIESIPDGRHFWNKSDSSKTIWD